DAEVRYSPFARNAAGEDLPLPPARAEPAGHEHAVDRLEQVGCLVGRHVLGVDPPHAHGAAVVQSRVLERLVDGEVRVLELHVLADECDLDELAPLVDAAHDGVPLAELRGASVYREYLAPPR